MKTLTTYLNLVLIASTCMLSADEPEEKIKTLIVDGFSNHDWEATTEAILSILRTDASFEVNVSTVPEQDTELWKEWGPSFESYDLVIQNTNDISEKGAWPESAKRSLEQYVDQGGGLLIFHSANNAFSDWVEYNKMIGLGWRDKEFGRAIVIQDGGSLMIEAGDGENTSHGKRVDTVVSCLGDHPIHRGLPGKWMAADLEVYRYARGPVENLSVISCAKDNKTGLNFPTEWVVRYGKGRVYNSTFGHYWHNLSEDPPGIRCNGFRAILCRAARWLAGAEVSEEVPDSFPSHDKISLHDSD